MIASEARIAANRANALKSTGPRTAAGKERSRANAVKHGLTGEGVALPTEDAAEVARRFAGLRADLAPTNELGEALVRRVALLSLRLDRCVEHESAAISAKVRHAGSDFDEARADEVDRLMEALGDAPAARRRKLLRMPEGVDRLIAGLLDLKSDLTLARPRWGVAHARLADELMGRRPESIPLTRVAIVSAAIAGDVGRLDDRGEEAARAGEDADEARRRRAVGQMVAILDAEVATLRAHRETLDLDAIAADRADAPRISLFDPSPEAALARKYEAAAERGLYRALRELKQVEQAAVADRAPAAATEFDPLGSFFPGPASPPDREAPPVAKPPVIPPAPRFPVARASCDVPMTIGRAPAGSA